MARYLSTTTTRGGPSSRFDCRCTTPDGVPCEAYLPAADEVTKNDPEVQPEPAPEPAIQPEPEPDPDPEEVKTDPGVPPVTEKRTAPAFDAEALGSLIETAVGKAVESLRAQVADLEKRVVESESVRAVAKGSSVPDETPVVKKDEKPKSKWAGSAVGGLFSKR